MSIIWEYVTNIRGPRGRRGEKGDPGLPGANGVPTDEAVSQLVGNDSSVTGPALDARYVRQAPAPTGDVDTDTMVLQQLVDDTIEAGGGEILLQRGTYKVGTIETDASGIHPIIRGAGRMATFLEGSGPDFIIRYVGATGTSEATFSPGKVSDLTMRSADGLSSGIELIATVGVKIERVTFDNLDTGLRFHNRDTGTWTEFCVAEDCWWKWTVKTAVEFKRTNGDASFHGCGISGTASIIEQSTSATGPSLVIGAGCTPYNAPLDVGFFLRHPTQALVENNNTTSTVFFHGVVRAESFSGAEGAGVLFGGTGGAVALIGSIMAMNVGITNGAVRLSTSQNSGWANRLPYSEYVTNIDCTTTGTTVQEFNFTFPTGRFTAAPHVFLQVTGGNPDTDFASVANITKTGGKIFLRTGTAKTRRVLLRAIQMLEGNASG